MQDSTTNTSATSAALTYQITKTPTPITAVTLNGIPAVSVFVGTPVNLYAEATGGIVATTTYQFQVGDASGANWSNLGAAGASAAGTWTPAATGTYTLQVIAHDATTNSSAKSAMLSYQVTAGGNGALSNVELSTNVPSPQPVNSPVTLSAVATGGVNIQYQFWVYNPSVIPAWSQLQEYSASASCVWTPSVPGSYLLSATAKDGTTGAEVNATLWYSITGGVPLTAVSVTASSSSPQPVNTPITLTAMATGGTNVQYQFWLYTPNGTPAWSPLQAYSSSASCTWNPNGPGDYLLSVSAKDGVTGTEVNATLWYSITGGVPLTAVVVTTSLSSPQPVNTPITLTATATGGTSVQYQFWLYNANTTPAWRQLQGYSASASCTWTPSAAGNYLLAVTAMDGITGGEANMTFWYRITGTYPLTAVAVTPSLPSPQAVDTQINLTATATGGVSVQYQFWVYNPSANPTWSPLQAYSPISSYNWTPAAVGTYLLSVTAEDGVTGMEVNTTFWYSVQ